MSHHAVFNKNGNLIGFYKNCIPQHIRANAEEFVTINDLDHLVSEMDRRDKRVEEVVFSNGDFLYKCLDKLDDLGESCEKLKQEGKKAIVEVKSLGVNSAVELKNKFTELLNNIMEKDSDLFPYKDELIDSIHEKDASDIFPSQKTKNRPMPYG